MTTELWRLPPPEKVRECVAWWRSLDLVGTSDEEIERSFVDLRDRIGSCLVQRRSTAFMDLWRVRRNGVRFDSVRGFWYPAPTIVRQGRCNRAGEPLLYVAPNAITALDEMEVAIGERLVLMRYRCTSQLQIDRVVGYEDPNPKQGDRILDGDDLLSYQILREFIQTEFTRYVLPGNEHLYRVSAAICRSWTASESNDGWLYPSVKSTNRENVALKPTSADNLLVLKHVYLLDVTNTRVAKTRFGLVQGIALRGVDSADVTGAVVTWKNAPVSMNFYR